MVKNNIEIDVKVKCLEEHKTQADIMSVRNVLTDMFLLTGRPFLRRIAEEQDT